MPIDKRTLLSLVFLVVLGLAAAGFAGETVGDALEPTIPDSQAADFQEDEEDADGGNAGAAPSPLEPTPGKPGRRGFRYGTILEYWLLEPGTRFRMPSDPSLTGMIDDARQYFLADAMLHDGELKNYVNRQGLVQWTCYFRVTRPGKHVFAMAVAGLPSTDSNFSGAALAFADGVRAIATAERDTSATVEFSSPGWYEMRIRIWSCQAEKPDFSQYAVTLKVREPGALSLRPIGRKELYYKQP